MTKNKLLPFICYYKKHGISLLKKCDDIVTLQISLPFLKDIPAGKESNIAINCRFLPIHPLIPVHSNHCRHSLLTVVQALRPIIVHFTKSPIEKTGSH